MQSALDAAVEGGYIVARINAKATGNEILWDSVADAFCYLNDGKVEYTPDVTGKKAKDNEKYKLWKIDSVPSDVFSTYLYNIGGKTEFNDVKTGIDVGNETVTSISYVGNDSAQDVVIRTNSARTTLTIEAALDTVKHYGSVGSLNIIEVASASYHEYGQVAFAEIATGRIVLESGSEINTVVATSADAVIDINGGEIEHKYATDASYGGANSKGNFELEVIAPNDVEEKKQEAIKLAISVARIDETYYETLEAAFLAVSSKTGDIVLEIINDVDMKSESWMFDLQGKTAIKTLTINGNNHVISNLYVRVAATNNPKGEPGAGASNMYGTGFIGRVGEGQTLTINNLSFDKARITDEGMSVDGGSHTSQVAVVVGVNNGRTYLNNVNVSNSYVSGGEKVAALIGHAQGTIAVIIGGSVKNSTIQARGVYAAPISGYGSKGKIQFKNVELVNNSFEKPDMIDENDIITLSNGVMLWDQGLTGEDIYGSDYASYLYYTAVNHPVFYPVAVYAVPLNGESTLIYGYDNQSKQYSVNGNIYSGLNEQAIAD